MDITVTWDYRHGAGHEAGVGETTPTRVIIPNDLGSNDKATNSVQWIIDSTLNNALGLLMKPLIIIILITLTGKVFASQPVETLSDDQLDSISGGAYVYFTPPDKVPPTPTGVPVPYPNLRFVLQNYLVTGR